MRAVDLFAGCGGLSLGLEMAGFEESIAVEKSEMAAETHFRNFRHRDAEWSNELWVEVRGAPHARQARDFGTVIADIWDVVGDPVENRRKRDRSALTEAMQYFIEFGPDVVAGGPPCQGFSMAGRRNPTDLRNKLPWAFLEFVRLTKPRAVIIENVVGINRAFRKAGADAPFEQLRQALEITGPGYVVQPVELNAKHYGIPQNRPRMMLLAIQRQIAEELDIAPPSPEPWSSSAHVLGRENPDPSPLVPLPTTSTENEWITAGDALADLNETTYNMPPEETAYQDSRLHYARSMRFDPRGTVPERPINHVLRRHTDRVRERFVLYGYLRDWGIPNSILAIPSREDEPRARAMIRSMVGDRAKPDDLGFNGQSLADVIFDLQTKKHTQRAINPDAPAPTVVTLPDDYIHPASPRIMTVRELARFQSFPDWFEFRNKETTGSDRRRYEVPQYSQVGNAVPPRLGEVVGRQIAGLLSGRRGVVSEAYGEYAGRLRASA